MSITIGFLSQALLHHNTITNVSGMSDLIPIIDIYYSYLVRRETYSEPKHFELSLLTSDLDKFKLHNNEFINNYINKHKSNNPHLTRDSVHSLLLGTAIILRDMEVIQHILSHFHEENILTYTDDSYYSPISATLLYGTTDILNLIRLYIEKYGEYIVKQNFICERDYGHLLLVLEFPQEYLNPYQCYSQYLVPLYTEEALKEIE